MIRYLSILIFVGFMQAGCNHTGQSTTMLAKPPQLVTTTLYAASVADSFHISVSLPADYYTAPPKRYPVVYLLDANLYFDIMATTLRSYAAVGLSPDVILVGIGYKDFPTMDSLRNRDYIYPLAIPEYEMSTSGGADKFLSFIRTTLIPFIDKSYHGDTSKRVLMGHSLGGYFTLYALLQQLTGHSSGFSSYIAASPSLHYNHYYLLQQFQKIHTGSVKLNAYFTFGGQEDAENTDSNAIKLPEVINQLSKSLTASGVHAKGDIYSNLDHMDTQLPTFIKGLQGLNEQ